MNDLLWFMGGIIVSVCGILVLAFMWQIDDSDYEEEEWKLWK